MPAPISVEAPRVAAAMLPVVAAALGIIVATRRAGWPRWRPRNRVWHGVEALPLQAAYLFAAGVVAQLLAAGSARPAADFELVAQLIAMAAAFLFAWALRTQFRGVPWPAGSVGDLARAVRLGSSGFIIVVVPTYAVYFVSLAALDWLGQSPVDHPRSQGPQTAVGGWPAYALALCVAAPWAEELIHRGVVQPWATRSAANALGVFGVAALAAYALGGDYGPAALALVAAAGLIAVGVSTLPGRTPRRTLVGILASATLFAALHANVWPTPVPLFVLACGLGWVAARGGGVVAPAVLHTLFNAVAVVRVALG